MGTTLVIMVLLTSPLIAKTATAGLLLLLSTIGLYTAQNEPTNATQPSLLLSCAAKLETGGSTHTVSEAHQFITKLQQNPDLNQTISLALQPDNPLHRLLVSIPTDSISSFEDCAELIPGLVISLQSRPSRASPYRKFLRSTFQCSGEAFRAAERAWPTEAMVLQMMGLMSVSWLESTSQLPVVALKYRPILSSLKAPGPNVFSRCMAGARIHPGRPGGRRSMKRSDVSWYQHIRELTGLSQPAPGPRMGPNDQVKGGSGYKSAGRRLLKGYGSFYGSYGDEGDYEADGCFSKDGTVVAARTRLETRLGDLEVGSLLSTTVPEDEVWYMHKIEGAVPVLNVELLDGTLVKLTGHHLLSTPKGMIPAAALKPGDMLTSQRHNDVALKKVKSIKHSFEEVIAPITMSGTIVVNGVVASFYAYGSHETIHLFLSPFRVIYKISPTLVRALDTCGLGVMHLLMTWLPLQAHFTSMLAISILVICLGPCITFFMVGKKLNTTLVKANKSQLY